MNRVDGPSGPKFQESNQGAGSAQGGHVSGRDADSFKKAVSGRDERGGGRGGEGGKSNDPMEAAKAKAKAGQSGKSETKLSPGAAMLKNMGGGEPTQAPPGHGMHMHGSLQANQAQVQPTPPAMPTARAEGVNQLVNSVADQIMVGAKGTAGEGEIRIQLKGDVLDGAEIRLKQDGGRLEVTFVTKTADAHNFLNNRAGELRSELNNRMDRDVQINVETKDDMDQQEQRDRRSRQEYLGEDEDGKA